MTSDMAEHTLLTENDPGQFLKRNTFQNLSLNIFRFVTETQIALMVLMRTSPKFPIVTLHLKLVLRINSLVTMEDASINSGGKQCLIILFFHNFFQKNPRG